MRFRCPVCNGELSYCGPDGPDGPTVDCMLCKLRQQRDEARKLLMEAVAYCDRTDIFELRPWREAARKAAGGDA